MGAPDSCSTTDGTLADNLDVHHPRKTTMKRNLQAVFGLIFAYLCLAAGDLLYLGGQASWSPVSKLRAKLHVEAYTNLMLFVPPIGPLDGVHTFGRLLDAYVDQDTPPSYSMSTLRSWVLDSEACREEMAKHERRALKGGPSSSEVKCRVPFAFGLGDTLQFLVYTQKTKDGPKTSFLEYGLGITASKVNNEQSPMHIFKDWGPVADAIGGLVLRANNLIRMLESEGVAKKYYIYISDRPETSQFSHQRLHGSKKASLFSEFKRETTKLNQAGSGKSVSELF